MIEFQRRYPKFPGHPWEKMMSDGWQCISLKDIKTYRFRFHGKLVETRRHLIEYIEKEIVHYRLRGKLVYDRMLDGSYKK